MSFRNFNLDFWADKKVLDDFTPEDRLVFIYLITSPQSNICGCYELSERMTVLQIGYTWETIEKVLHRMQDVLNVISYDAETHEVFIHNFGKYNWSPSEKLIFSARKKAMAIKSERLRKLVLDKVLDKEIEIQEKKAAKEAAEQSTRDNDVMRFA